RATVRAGSERTPVRPEPNSTLGKCSPAAPAPGARRPPGTGDAKAPERVRSPGLRSLSHVVQPVVVHHVPTLVRVRVEVVPPCRVVDGAVPTAIRTLYLRVVLAVGSLVNARGRKDLRVAVAFLGLRVLR